jgi:phospholipid/cholesterol/gamma-HCH transport system substrate-binding protein
VVVPEPGAPITLDTQKIIPRATGLQTASFGNAQWSDTVPKLVQAKIIEALDNSHYLSAVARPLEGLAADYQLVIDIRAFEVAVAPGEAAEIEFAAKVLGKSGRIVAGKVFAAKASQKSPEVAAAVAALDEAFGKATVELAAWVANVLQGQPPQKRS